MRVDKYVHMFINYIQGRLKLTDAKLQTMETTTEIDGSQIEENNIEEHEVEKHMVEEHEIEENVKFDSLTVSDEDSNNSSQAVSIDQNKACPACYNNDKPTGNHKCFICHRPVHNLDTCSEPLKLTDEGFGQKRICFKCKDADNINIIIGMRHEENWRNQNLQLNSVKQTSRAEKSNASTNDEKIAKYYGGKAYKIKEDLQVTGKNKKITVLKNGSSDKLNPVNIEGKRIHCIYTCPFDTVYQILLAAICDRPHFYAQVEKQRENNEMYDLVLRTFEKGITAATYTNRAKFHYKFIKHSEQPDGSILLECVTTVEQIVMRMFANTPSVQIMIKCNACSASHVRNIIAPIVYMSDMQTDEIDLTKLDNLSMVTVCRTEGCKGQRQTSISSLGDMVILEVFDSETNMNRKLNSIPKYVKNCINSKQIYKLVGVADYTIPSLGTRRSSDQSIGHFTAVCLRGTQWIEYDDRCDKEIRRKDKSLVYPRILMYVKLQ